MYRHHLAVGVLAAGTAAAALAISPIASASTPPLGNVGQPGYLTYYGFTLTPSVPVPGGSGAVEDPGTFGGVNVANGNFYYSTQLQEGYEGLASTQLFYNSLLGATKSGLGSGWTMSDDPDINLTAAGPSVRTLNGPSGYQIAFTNGTPPLGFNGQLDSYDSGTRVEFPNDVQMDIGPSGVESIYGDNKDEAVDTGVVNTTIDGAPRLSELVSELEPYTFSFNYDTTGRLTKFPSSTPQYNAQGLFTGDTSGNLTQQGFTYNAAGELTSVDGGTETLTYDSNGRVSTLTYSPQGGATATYTFQYGASQTTVTDGAGNGDIYFYDTNGQVTGTQGVGPAYAEAVNNFIDDVESLGEQSYSSTFTGASLGPNGTVTIYANPQTDSQFRAAVATLNTSNLPVTYVASTVSQGQLASITTNISNADSTLTTDGIDVMQVSPDATTGQVDVSLSQPTPAEENALGQQQSLYNPVTNSNYVAAAQYVLNQHYGPGIAVSSSYVTVAGDDNSYDDSSPFTGGDVLLLKSGGECSGGFNVTVSGSPFMITAGHCGINTWYNFKGKLIGTVPSNERYIDNPPNHDDFELISVSAAKPNIWFDGVHSIIVSGSANAIGTGSHISVYAPFSGGEHNENDVLAAGITRKFGEIVNGEPSGPVHLVKNLVEFRSDDGSEICGPGDSGGPIFLRTNSGKSVKAVGTIVGDYGDPGASSNVCYGELIHAELQHAVATLLTKQP